MMFIAVYLSYDVCKCWPENLLCRGGWKLIKYTLSPSDDSVNNSGIMGEIDWGLRYKPYRAYKEYISVEESRVNKGPHSEGSIITPPDRPVRWTPVTQLTPSWPLKAVNLSIPGSPHPGRKRWGGLHDGHKEERSPLHSFSHVTYTNLYVKVN